MTQALFYGAISGFALVIGALAGIFFKLSQKTIAAFMAFGSGVLICALTFGLMSSAFIHGGFDAIIIGFLLGGIIFVVLDYCLHLIGARKHKRKQHLKTASKSSHEAIALGAILDGVPESIALGISLFSSQSLGILMFCAIFLSNVPEGLSSVPGLLKESFKKWQIILIWVIVATFLAIVTALSYQYLNRLNPNNIGIIESFAAGAILAMLASSMMPEAYEEGGFSIAILTVLGFLVAFIISRL